MTQSPTPPPQAPPRGGAAIDRSFRAALARLQPDTVATLMESDGSSPRPLTITITNTRSMKTTRESGKFATGAAPAGTAILPGQLIAHGPAAAVAADIAGGTATAAWYIVQDVALAPAGSLSVMPREVQLRALPYVLTVERAVPTAGGAPRRFDNSGAPLVIAPQTDAALVTTTTTIRAAFSTDNNLRQDTTGGAGPAVTGLTTLITPLGSAVAEGDVIIMPVTSAAPASPAGPAARYRVTNRQTADAAGAVYAAQLLLREEI